MEPILAYKILPQGFEQVGDRIGEIIFLELTNQKENHDNFDEDILVFKERITPASTEEEIYFNVLFATSDNTLQSQKDNNCRTLYHIDVYTTGKAEDGKTGSDISSKRLLKGVGLIRGILAFTGYNTLGFEDGLIGNTMIENISTQDPSFMQDSNFSRFARITFAVKILENQEMWQGTALAESQTTVKLEETERGYKFITDNN